MSVRLYLEDAAFFDDLQEMFNVMPEYEETLIERVGERFKKDLREDVRSSVKSDRKLTKGFWTELRFTSKLNAYVQFGGEKSKVNPHWHLIEHGHKIVRPDRNMWGKPYTDAGDHLGEVQGIEAVAKMTDKYYDIMEEAAYDVINQAANDGNL
jgi:hypothetical protein